MSKDLADKWSKIVETQNNVITRVSRATLFGLSISFMGLIVGRFYPEFPSDQIQLLILMLTGILLFQMATAMVIYNIIFRDIIGLVYKKTD
jgi:hypothetical protein